MKNKGLIVIGIIVLLVIIFAGKLIGGYNNLVALETDIGARWAQVENQLQRRSDLIPNLVETVKGYAAHESQVFTDIAEARSKLAGSTSPEEAIAANSELESALSRLLVIVEQYPQLKADQNFIRLQDELTGTENRIAVERMRYNEAVQTWNRTIKQFPTVLLASMLGKTEKKYFEASPEAQKVPEVKF